VQLVRALLRLLAHLRGDRLAVDDDGGFAGARTARDRLISRSSSDKPHHFRPRIIERDPKILENPSCSAIIDLGQAQN